MVCGLKVTAACTPVPLTLTNWKDLFNPGIFSAELRSPLAWGLKVTSISQLALMSSDVPQVLVCEKSLVGGWKLLASVIGSNEMGALPSFSTLILSVALVLPITTFPNRRAGVPGCPFWVGPVQPSLWLEIHRTVS